MQRERERETFRTLSLVKTLWVTQRAMPHRGTVRLPTHLKVTHTQHERLRADPILSSHSPHQEVTTTATYHLTKKKHFAHKATLDISWICTCKHNTYHQTCSHLHSAQQNNVCFVFKKRGFVSLSLVLKSRHHRVSAFRSASATGRAPVLLLKHFV